MTVSPRVAPLPVQVDLERRFIEADGYRIYTRLSESGSSAVPIVLVHGLGVSGRYMLPTARRLATDYRVYVPDLPGFGRSSGPAEAPAVEAHARTLDAWMDRLGIEQALVLGNSFGCQVAVSLAVAAPGRVSRLVLTGPAIDQSARTTRTQIRRLVRAAFREPVSLSLLAVWDFLRCGPRWMAQTLERAMEDRIEQKLPLVECPALVLRGTRDALVSQAWCEKVAGLLPRGRLVVLPDQPHTLNYAAPEDVARLTRAFATNALPPVPSPSGRRFG